MYDNLSIIDWSNITKCKYCNGYKPLVLQFELKWRSIRNNEYKLLSLWMTLISSNLLYGALNENDNNSSQNSLLSPTQVSPVKRWRTGLCCKSLNDDGLAPILFASVLCCCWSQSRPFVIFRHLEFLFCHDSFWSYPLYWFTEGSK